MVSRRPNPLLRLPAAADNAAMQTEPSKADPPKRKRRWFQFSLRTLLIVVTVLAVVCAYVGWQAKIVREREAMLIRLHGFGGDFITSAKIQNLIDSGWWRSEPSDWRSDLNDDQHHTVPWIRRWLGDQPIIAMWVPRSIERNAAEEIMGAFPEARISRAKFPLQESR
jgi:hypothetical protein